MQALWRAFRSEWLKRRRSFASTLVLAGSLFTPAVILVVRLIHPRDLPAVYAAPAFWATLWRDAWESMAIFFLPLAAIMATSLVTHLEFRGNAWKQVHTLPLHPWVIFVSKLLVIVVMVGEFLLLFNAGLLVAAVVPSLLVPGVPWPQGSLWSLPLLGDNARYLLDCLPVIAAQYLLALRISNVLVPIGAGFLAWVGALATVSSKVAIWWPYAYTIVEYLKDKPKGAHLLAHTEIHALAAAAALLLAVAGYVAFTTNPRKG
jgi:hypothetical protein